MEARLLTEEIDGKQMSFIQGFLNLPLNLENAYIKAAESGKGGKSPEEITTELANDLGDAIHNYMKTALVATAVTITPGQTATHPVSGKASYTSPGTGIGAGKISFKNKPVSDLKKEIKDALDKRKDEGAISGCDPVEIVRNFSKRITEAIHKFSLTAVVETGVILDGGVVLNGYLTPAGAPAASTSLPTPPGLATGLGDPEVENGTGLS